MYSMLSSRIPIMICSICLYGMTLQEILKFYVIFPGLQSQPDFVTAYIFVDNQYSNLFRIQQTHSSFSVYFCRLSGPIQNFKNVFLLTVYIIEKFVFVQEVDMTQWLECYDEVQWRKTFEEQGFISIQTALSNAIPGKLHFISLKLVQ